MSKHRRIDWGRVDLLGMAWEMKLQGEMEGRFVREARVYVRQQSALNLVDCVRFYSGLALQQSKELVASHIGIK